MNKPEHRYVMKLFVLNVSSPSEIHLKLIKVYHENAPLFLTVKKRHLSLNVVVHRLKMIHMMDVQNCNHRRHDQEDTRLDGRRLKVYEIASTVGTSDEIRIWHNLHQALGMRKLCTRVIPNLFNTNHKQKRSRLSQQPFKKNFTDFIRRFVKMD